MDAGHDKARCTRYRLSPRRRARWFAAGILLLVFSGSRAFSGQMSGNADKLRTLMARAQQLINARNYRGAANAYQQALQLSPDSLAVLNNLGVIYAHLGDYTRAAEAYERALRLAPNSFPLLLNLGLTYYKSGNYEAAAKPFAKAVSLQPGNFQARTLLAMSYYGSQKYALAGGQFEKLIAARPDNTTLQFLLAQSYLQSHQGQKLLDYFHHLLGQSHDSATVHMLMGEADDGLDRRREAIQEFKAAAALNPALPDVNFGLGYLYWKTKQYDKAAAAFQREIEEGGDVAKAEAYWGDVLVKQGKLRQARALLTQAVREFPKSYIAHLDLGILDADAKNYHGAAGEYLEAIRLHPTRANAHYRLAAVYRAEGNTKLAEEQLKAVAAIHNKSQQQLFKEVSGPPPAQH